MSLPRSFHTDLGMTMIDVHALNRGGPGAHVSLSDIDLSTVANDPRPSASFSARSLEP